MDTPPGIQLENVTRFFREAVPGGDVPLRFELISGGRSNLTYRVDIGGRSVALAHAVGGQPHRAAAGDRGAARAPARALPARSDTALVHGDYRFGKT